MTFSVHFFSHVKIHEFFLSGLDPVPLKQEQTLRHVNVVGFGFQGAIYYLNGVFFLLPADGVDKNTPCGDRSRYLCCIYSEALQPELWFSLNGIRIKR